MTITIKPVKDAAGSFHFQELVRRVWGSDDEDVVPNHVTVTIIKNGGHLLGAYALNGPEATGGLVGAAFGWLGIAPQADGTVSTPPRFKICSHMLGVMPEWQGHGIGLQLKLAQRDWTLAQGLTNWMAWTYDPLYRPNGIFNMHRLGATCNTYLRDVYGELQDDLNRGVPSDRCQVDWYLHSPHILTAADQKRMMQHWDTEALVCLPTVRRSDGFLYPVETVPCLDGAPIGVPIPEDIGAIRRVDPELSLTWRLYLRTVLEPAFAAGYVMVDCVRVRDEGWFYILVPEADSG